MGSEFTIVQSGLSLENFAELSIGRKTELISWDLLIASQNKTFRHLDLM